MPIEFAAVAQVFGLQAEIGVAGGVESFVVIADQIVELVVILLSHLDVGIEQVEVA